MWIVAQIPKKIKLVRQNMSKKNIYCAAIFHIYEQKLSNPRPLCSITFPQEFGQLIPGSGGKKTFKRSEQMKKISKKLFFDKAI